MPRSGLPGAEVLKNPAAKAARQAQSLLWEDATGRACSRATEPVSRAPDSQVLQPACLELMLCNEKPPR